MSMRKNSRRNARLLAGKLALLAGSLAVGALLSEGLFRSISGEEVNLTGLYSNDDTIGVVLTPDFRGSMETSEFRYEVSINELKMRDGPVVAKSAEELRILMIGDSFVFGVGVNLEDSVAKVLERRLGPVSPDRTIKVLNAGVPGYSPYLELHTLRRLVPHVMPDLVIQVVFVGDDWFGNGPRKPPQEARASLIEQLRIQSALFRYVDRFVLSRLKGREQYNIHKIAPDPEFKQRMDEVLSLLEETRATAHEAGADFLVVLNPRYVQAYEEAWTKAAFVYRLDAAKYSPLEPNQLFSQRLKDRGFWTMDLVGPFRAEGHRRTLHFPVDGHWNQEGNDFVGSEVSKEVSAWLLRSGKGIAGAGVQPPVEPAPRPHRMRQERHS